MQTTSIARNGKEPVKVVKFGGSSLADAAQFRKCVDIIRADPARRYVVPSAPGRRMQVKGDFKVTDKLYECYELATSGMNFDACFAEIENRYRSIVEELGMDYCLDDEFAQIRAAILHKAGRDYAASRGEYLNARILAKYLGFAFIDAAEVIFFKDNGSFDSERTNDVLGARLRECRQAVIPGFYGAMPNDTIKTFSRGGSDITGSIVARAAEADLYENWTDVSGFLMADPRIVDHPATIRTITYNELRELSYMGATVLHEDAIFPVRVAGIPINIRNTNDPTADGTMIVSEAPVGENAEDVITGIAGKRGFCTITVEKDRMNSEIGFVRRVLTVLEVYEVSFEHLPTGIDTMSVVINEKNIEGKREQVLRGIAAEVRPDHITLEDGLALIAVVGRGMRRVQGTAARVCAAVADAGINIVMMDQGSSELNIIIGVREDDFNAAMLAIYEAFRK